MAGYPGEVWKAVELLWPSFQGGADRFITPYVPAIPAFLERASRGGVSPEAAAVEILAFFMRLYVENSFKRQDKEAYLVELHQLDTMPAAALAQARVRPFAAHVWNARGVTRTWAAEGKIEAADEDLLFLDIAAALAERDPPRMLELGWLTLRQAAGPAGDG
jgi:hypothetical protein